jgi:RNA polymerase sigma factor (sigma-70 family)
LDRFLASNDSFAFEELVKRHSGMVLGVCRRITGSESHAEDAAQAVFIALAKKAKSLRSYQSIAGWLHNAARFTSLHLRDSEILRKKREEEAMKSVQFDSVEVPYQMEEEFRALLDQELSALPEKYRQALILHHLEGMKIKEAAQSLGLSMDTLATHIRRGRDLLHKRLVRRGIVLTSAAFTLLLDKSAEASISSSFVQTTTKTVFTAIGKGSFVTAVSESILNITNQILRRIIMKQLQTATLITLLISFSAIAATMNFTPQNKSLTPIAVSPQKPTNPAPKSTSAQSQNKSVEKAQGVWSNITPDMVGHIRVLDDDLKVHSEIGQILELTDDEKEKMNAAIAIAVDALKKESENQSKIVDETSVDIDIPSLAPLAPTVQNKITSLQLALGQKKVSRAF